MYTLIIKDEDGNESIAKDVIDYTYLNTEDIDTIVDDYDLEPLTQKQIDKVVSECRYLERFPDMEDLRQVIENVLSEDSDDN